MDVAGLSKLSRQAIVNLCMALGFLAHGYATGEFEVTEERLGVYLPVEHIDNPKGYNDGKDARQVHPALRPPVQDIELQIDPRTGMKNYIANENGHWDTSAACVRRTMLRCIDMGRRARASGRDEDLYEAYRLLGQFLHTLEDLPAHSNWCELMLQKLGHRQVFDHVGSNVRVRSPDGHMVAPLVTGTFGSADFIHSLLGEAGDHISEASVSDLSKALNDARSSPSSSMDGLRSMLFQLPGGAGGSLSRDVDGIANINRGPGSKAPQDMSPQELHAVLWQVLTFRDDICKSIAGTIEKIPGLSSLIDKITDSINKFVLTTLDPYLRPIMANATGVLQTGSAEVVNKQDQYEVFDNPNASDPTHSLLSKDHFGGILNEPAGELAKIILRHAARAIVDAWDNTSLDPNQIVGYALTAFHHPFFESQSPLQKDMQAFMEKWINSHKDRDYILRALTKEEVRAGRNKRKGHYDAQQAAQQSFLPTPQALYQQASNSVSNQFNQAMNNVPGYGAYQHMTGRRDMEPESGMPQPSYNQSGYDGPSNSYQPSQYQQSYNGGGFPEPGRYEGASSFGGPSAGQGYGAQQNAYDPYRQQQGFPQPGGAYQQQGSQGQGGFPGQQYAGQQYQGGYEGRY